MEQDVLVVYYAGHGVMNGEAAENRDFYIVPYDVTQLYGKDEMLKEKAISANELKKFAMTSICVKSDVVTTIYLTTNSYCHHTTRSPIDCSRLPSIR